MTKTLLGTSVLCLCLAFAACGGDDDDDGGTGGAGSGGTGAAGKSGSGGKSGAGGKSGTGGSSGNAGSGGSGDAGQGNEAGTSGSGGSGGSGGSAGNGEAGSGESGSGGAIEAGGSGGEAGGGGGEPGPVIELRGRWTGELGGDGIIDNDRWGEDELVEFSNDDNVAITQNADDADEDPSKFNRVVWTDPAMAAFYYCVADAGLDSASAARASDTEVDASEPETGGCNGAPWIKLTSNDIEIFGTWASEFTTETIDALSWTMESSSGTSVAAVIEFSNDDNVAITQNADDAEFDPGLFNRIVWTEFAGPSFFYCTTDFGLATLEAAQTSTTETDDSEPAVTGCGGFAWTELSLP